MESSNNSKKIAWFLIVVVVIGLLFFGGKGDSIKKTSETGPIKVGFISPMTGEASSLGTVAQIAAQLAVEEINSKGGINGRQIEMIYEDGKCGSSAASAAQKLINVDKVSAIVGGLCSGETASFVKNAMDNKVGVISYCSSAPKLTGSGKYFFRNFASDIHSAAFAADFLYNKAGAKKVAVIYHVSDYGSALQKKFNEEFTKIGGTVVVSEGVQQNSKDFKTQLAKIKAANPDYIYAILYSEGGAVAVNQANELGIKTKMLFPEPADDPVFIKAVSGKADIIYHKAKSPENAEFETKITTKTKGTSVPICAPQSYDAVKILAEVYSKVGTNADDFAKEMHKVNYQGVAGATSFDENGDLKSSEYILMRIEDGKATEIK